MFTKRLELLKRAPVPAELGKRREDREGWPTFERKREVARKCARLNGQRANEAAGHVWRGCKAALKEEEVPVGSGVHQAVVDLDAVDEETFAKVEAVVKQAQS